MKRSTKFLLGAALLLIGSTALTGCTASFCSVKDQANMLYAYDYGVTNYQDNATASKAYYYDDNLNKIELENVYYTAKLDFCSTIGNITNAAVKEGLSIPSLKYWETLDAVVLGQAIKEAQNEDNIGRFSSDIQANLQTPRKLTASEIRKPFNEKGDYGILDTVSYIKFYDDSDDSKLWDNYTYIVTKVNHIMNEEGILDQSITTDFFNFYQSKMQGYVSANRSCLATKDGYYGAYGPQQIPVSMEGKKWTDWKGLLEFLFVWPLGAFIDVVTEGFLNMGIATGLAQVIAIVVLTVIIRSLMLLVTFKQTSANAKMTELQPQIAKIQAKYPNANTNNYEKQRMAEEMSRLYKKNKVNPLSSLIVMFVQFPVFICVWGAMQGSALLSTGEFLGLSLASSVGSNMFSGAAWKSGAGATALVLFILMSLAQAVAMLLPQWLQKHKLKDVAKLGKNPAQNSQNNKMKWFTYIMLAMMIIMGYSLVSAMGVYWLIGALYSIAQTLITNAITNKKAKKGKK